MSGGTLGRARRGVAEEDGPTSVPRSPGRSPYVRGTLTGQSLDGYVWPARVRRRGVVRRRRWSVSTVLPLTSLYTPVPGPSGRLRLRRSVPLRHSRLSRDMSPVPEYLPYRRWLSVATPHRVYNIRGSSEVFDGRCQVYHHVGTPVSSTSPS